MSWGNEYLFAKLLLIFASSNTQYGSALPAWRSQKLPDEAVTIRTVRGSREHEIGERGESEYTPREFD